LLPAALALDRPLLRVANALGRLAADDEAGPSGSGGSGPARRLMDVHVGLPPSKVTGGTVHLVDGSYEYFHYLQVLHLKKKSYHFAFIGVFFALRSLKNLGPQSLAMTLSAREHTPRGLV
jgi:hypothetical protein